MERITISIDDELAERFDALVARHGYGSRSEAMRDLVRDALEHERIEQETEGESFGVLTYVYNHHERGLAGRITQTQHEHHHLARSTLHVHIDHDNCLEAVILHGPTAELVAFSNALMASTGVRYGRLHLLPGELEHHAGHHHRHGGPHRHD
jgi:CopG family nickel-responsive transcriptional regulator